MHVTQREVAMREVDISLQKAGFFEERDIDIEAILEMYKKRVIIFMACRSIL